MEDPTEDGYFQITKGGLREVSDATTASSIFKKILEQREAVSTIIGEAPKQSDSDAVVNEANKILKALEERELLKAISKRIK